MTQTPQSLPQLRGLYAITDSTLMPPSTFIQQARAALLGGASVIQYRDKSNDTDLREQQALALRELCNEHNCLLIINDDIKLAQHCNADGVHLGQDDNSIAQARETLGKQAIIGASCYNSLELALKAASAGASYLAFGRFFASKTKPGTIFADTHLIQQVKHQIDLPTVAIGGITAQNAAPIVTAGVDMLAVINGLFGSQDIQASARSFCYLFK